MSQSSIQSQQMHIQPPPEQAEMQFWLEKAVAWGQADSPDAQRDICSHLSRLKNYLQRVLSQINETTSTADAMTRLPSLGQFLGRLCWNPFVTADGTGRSLLFQCLFGLYSEHPSDAVERKANQWIRSLFCQLGTEEHRPEEDTFVEYMSVTPTQYHLEVLKKTVQLLKESTGKNCSFLGRMNQRILATSEACVPLVACAEVAPLVAALLRQPLICPKAALCKEFLNAVQAAYSSRSLSLEDRDVVSLWYLSLGSLEEAVLGLLESVLGDAELSPQNLQKQVEESLLPKACAQHCSIFWAVSDIFRSTLKEREENERVRSLIQTFTACFYKELQQLQPQARPPLKAFFPQAPHNLLVPLLTPPPEVPPEVRGRHLNRLSASLRELTREEEEPDRDGGSTGGRGALFEAWFLLVLCARWVEAAVGLLATAGPEERDPLLWLLTFCYHPTNRGHHRALQLVNVKQAWERLNLLLAVWDGPPPPPAAAAAELQELAALLSRGAPQPRPDPALILRLLVGFALFGENPTSDSAAIFQTVVVQGGAVGEAARVLGSLEHQLAAAGQSPSDGDGTLVRIEALRRALERHTAAQ